jgi:hypothetical protein
MTKTTFKNIVLIALLFSTTFLLSRTSEAYLSLKETAELVPDGIFKLGVAPQLKLSDGSGFNIGAYFDTSLSEDMNGRVEIGGGETDFWTSGSVKWVPFPDVGRQPAIGGRLALIYARDEKVNFYNVQFSPILSKLAHTTYGKMIPFVGLPITWVSTKDDSFVATQFAVGAEWFSNKDMHVGAELDLNLNKSFSSLTAFISFPFDQATGYKKK